MVTFADALRTVLDRVRRLNATRVPLGGCLGAVLAEDVASDVDMPPFDKSAMDGFAVVAADLRQVPQTLRVVEEVPAGAVPTRQVRPGECSRIMTGAPVPAAADAVVRVEDTRPGPGDGAVTVLKPIEAGANICWRAEDVARGDVVLRAGHVVRPPEVALLASCGCAQVPVFRRPTVAVLSTGNEVVPADQVPKAGQIRDANSPYVAARLRLLGIEAAGLGIAADEPGQLRAALRRGLEHDVLVVSGGVSMGDYDLVPGVLGELGAETVFDSVAMQPGRPTVFALCGKTRVFGLPGNPVAVMVGTELLLVPALRAMMGYREVNSPRRRATLAEPVRHRPGRLAHVPGVLGEAEGTGSPSLVGGASAPRVAGPPTPSTGRQAPSPRAEGTGSPFVLERGACPPTPSTEGQAPSPRAEKEPVPPLSQLGETGWVVRPLPYHGSAHVAALSQSNCLIALPADVAVVEAGAMVEVIALPGNP